MFVSVEARVQRRHRKSRRSIAVSSLQWDLDKEKTRPNTICVCWDRLYTCGATQVDASASARISYHHMSRLDNGRGSRRLLLACRLSTALVSPFIRARLPQSHRLRLSWSVACRTTTLTHRFVGVIFSCWEDYNFEKSICQAPVSNFFLRKRSKKWGE